MDRQLLLAKKEVTYGTAPVLSPADALLAENVTFKLADTEVTLNTAKPGSGAEPAKSFGQHCELGFEIQLATSGALGVAPKWGHLPKACGWSETIVAATSVTYAMMVNALLADSETFIWRDGEMRKHLVTGWRGRMGLKLSAGGIPKLTFNGRGLHHDVTQAAGVLVHADADWTGWKDADPVSKDTTTFEFDGIAGLGVREFGFEQSDNVKYINVPGQENVQLRGERKFTGNAKFTEPPPNTINFETIWRRKLIKPFSMVHGQTAGDVFTVNGNTQIGAPDYSRDDESDVVGFSTTPIPTSRSSDNELQLVLT